MLIIKKLKKLPSGEFEASWSLSEEEASYLLSYAINSLIGEGVVTVIEKEKHEISDKQMQLDFLANVPLDSLGKAQ